MLYKLFALPLLCCLVVMAGLATTVQPARAEYYWNNGVTNQLPNNAVDAGTVEDTPYSLYVCRARHNGNLHPGKLAYYNGRWSCFIGNGGVEQRYETYDVLIVYGTTRLSWEWSQNSLPAYAMPGGRVSGYSNLLYICRAIHNDNSHAGKLVYDSGRWSCYIGNGGQEQRYDSYYALKLIAP